jgi:hypothetical protein
LRLFGLFFGLCFFGVACSDTVFFFNFQVLTRGNTTDLKKTEISIALMELGNLFGKYQKAPTAEFQMFAPFDNENNVLFQVRLLRKFHL